ncbi:MAG: hypothetical protein HYU66_01770, partial [Armatimonadetes bacterium]|nr:hypothetical protein [Armatimonadota bacterium]
PEFKLAEWGVNQDGWRRCFFNGIGWIGTDYGVGWEVFQVLRENGDAFATLHPEPLVATLQSHVLANRFPAAGKVVYTLYNKNSTAVAGDLLTVPGAPGCHYVELRYDRPVTARHDRGRDTLALDVLPTDVVCLAQLPSLLQARAEGGVVRIRVTGKADKGVLWAFLDRDDSHLLQPTGRPVPVRDGVAELNVREVFGRDGRVILKLVRDQHLLDEVVLGA